MAHTVALTTLFARIRVRANVRDVKFTNTILDPLVKLAILDVVDIILDENPSYGLKPSADLNLVSGNDTVALPADFYKLHGVRVKDDDGKWRRIGTFAWEDQEDPVVALTNRTGLRYAEDGVNLRFQSAPGWSETGGLRVYYVNVPAVALAAYGVAPLSWDSIFGWDEHVTWNCVAQVLDAKKMDPSFAAGMMSRAEARIRKVAKRRDLINPPRQRDGRARQYSRYKLPG